MIPPSVLLAVTTLLPFKCLEAFFSPVFAAFAILLALFSINLTAFNLVFSRLFKVPETCTKWIIILHLGAVFAVLTLQNVLQVLQVTSNSSYEDVNDALDYISSAIIPAYSLITGIQTIMDLKPPFSLSQAYSVESNELKITTLMSLTSFVLYFTLAIVIEIVSMRIGKSSDESLRASLQEDPDVTAERTRIERTDIKQAMKENSVIVRRVRKVFKSTGIKKKPPVVAVNNISFGIRENDCFGLLGPNGAGKSTLINMMTAELGSTSGTIGINGKKVEGWKHKLYPELALGRCLQSDALMDFLTVAQHIRIMASLRCDATKRSIERDTEYALRSL